MNLIKTIENETLSHKISYLDTMVFTDINNKLHKTSYRKPIDQQSYLHVKWEHPFSSKKTVCSTEHECQRNCTVMKQKFLKRGSNKISLSIQM